MAIFAERFKMKTQNKQLFFAAAFLILAAAVSRLINMPPNFAPIASLAIFGGSILDNKKYAFIFPLAALLISDVLFQLFTKTPGFYGWGQLFVYGAFMLITYLSTRIKKPNAGNIFLACIWSAGLFFIISNFGDWVARSYYPKTFGGLMECYAAAIPFYKQDLFGNMLLNSVMSNFFFSAILFGAYALVRNTVAQKQTAKA